MTRMIREVWKHRTDNKSEAHHHTCSRTPAEVQLAVNITQVISHRPDGAVERDYIAILILQLRGKISGLSAPRRVIRRGFEREAYHDVVGWVAAGSPAVLIAIRPVK